jgi:hypothetical protein
MRHTKKMISALTVLVVLMPIISSALTLEGVGDTIGVGSADLKSTVIKIIQWVLGLLGLIAVIMIMYGVFGALTSSGNEDKMAFAKKTIIAAVIGLVVVLLAWAIVFFVARTATNVSG